MMVSSAAPRHCLLSNGQLTLMIDRHGAGFSRWRDLAVTRWREDPTVDGWGSWLLLRDEGNGEVWSPTQQPFGHDTPDDAKRFEPGRATFHRRHHSLHCMLEVAVAADADVELRRLTLSNHGDRVRHLSVTSYAELVLGPAGADDGHPAFSKMFVQTGWDAGLALLLATRRKRSNDEATVWAAQALQIAGAESAASEIETDRMRFLGRGRTLRYAQGLQAGAALGGGVGCVLDPVFAQRRHFTLAPDSEVTVLLWASLADSRAGALALATQAAAEDAAARLFDGAMQQAQARLRQYGIDEAQAVRAAHWLDALLVSDPAQRAAPEEIARGHGGAPTLWAAGISGDRPVALLRLRSEADLPRVQELLRAQQLWRAQRCAMDVVLLTTDDAAVQPVLDPLVKAQQAQLKAGDGLPKAELFALQEGTIGDDLRNGLACVARLVLDGEAAPRPAVSVATPAAPAPPLRATRPARDAAAVDAAPEFPNGCGGFVEQGRAYRVELAEGDCTPQPWVNVIANPAFGFLVSAEGGGYAWSINSQQNPLTPWPNDPVSDSPHEVLYLRDEDNGALWSATALPIRVAGAKYAATHGKGWSRFETDAHGIALELVQCVPVDDALKLARVRLANRSPRMRRLSFTAYVEWALGPNGAVSAPFVQTARDEKTGALFARNRWRPDFGDRVAFADLGGAQQAMSGDRAGFLGPLGAVDCPAALRGDAPLPGRFGAGLDPCGALQLRIELPPHTEIELRWLLGDAPGEAAAQAMVARYRAIDLDAVLAAVAVQWNGLLDAVQVRTPDRALDLMLNDWLLYQVASCRLWARTAYYQASGAWGFRDQLQDVMALCVSRPDLAREHLLRAAGRQFAEGDVQHWWLPPDGQGIRTRISDDRVWLAHVAAHYVEVSGDAAVLDEALPFLTGQAIPDGATDAYFQPGSSDEKPSLHEHCARALDSALTRGAHGLPLMGTGDWNDGMNAVGAGGRGESSWMGWFLIRSIEAYAPLAEARGDKARAQRWRDYAKAMRAALEQAWDGAWYRRGYYDDGTPLGSAQGEECRIDTLAQSWSVLAGAADAAHAAQAMAANERELVDREHRLSRLFTPPFDHARENPGYIKGYPPGVRENGGQYTHGAVWSIFAWAALGDGDRAGELFGYFNPIRHSDDAGAVARYRVEPYVSCADVYSMDELAGRGGWTWYTGSAAWLYRAGLEALLGFRKQGGCLRIDPCVPKHWPGFELDYRHRGAQHLTRYAIRVENPHGVCRGVGVLELDGRPLPVDEPVELVDDGAAHVVRVLLG
ncbi:glycosyl transferase family 36 [Rhodanobacter sp. Si-c]|uniref:Glycosyl transferase family 36 n=1 Tax=Rhodanobacter lycopersici TaxID=3162487 RepID=A0ABV3QEH0_9GAMM